jgi:hypothetical protein
MSAHADKTGPFVETRTNCDLAASGLNVLCGGEQMTADCIGRFSRNLSM